MIHSFSPIKAGGSESMYSLGRRPTLKVYLIHITFWCKGLEIRKSEFVAKTQFLSCNCEAVVYIKCSNLCFEFECGNQGNVLSLV